MDLKEVYPKLLGVFREHGYGATSIGMLVDETKLGRSTLYKMFPDGKKEMAEAVLDCLHLEFKENCFEALRKDEPEVAIAQMLDYVSKSYDDGQLISFHGSLALDDSREEFADRISEFFKDWHKALTLCLEHDGLPRTEARLEAMRVIALIQGAIVMARSLKSKKPFQDCMDAIRESFIG